VTPARRLWASAVLAAVACGGTDAFSPAPPPPTPPVSERGVLLVSLATESTEGGAMLLDLTGGPVDSLKGESGYEAYGNVPASTATMLVVGNLTSGPIATLYIPDASRAPSYRVQVREVAARGTYALRDVSAYGVSLR
jgi:hypothetical protein